IPPDLIATSAHRIASSFLPRAGCRIRLYASKPPGTTELTPEPKGASLGANQSASTTRSEGRNLIGCTAVLPPVCQMHSADDNPIFRIGSSPSPLPSNQ